MKRRNEMNQLVFKLYDKNGVLKHEETITQADLDELLFLLGQEKPITSIGLGDACYKIYNSSKNLLVRQSLSEEDYFQYLNKPTSKPDDPEPPQPPQSPDDDLIVVEDEPVATDSVLLEDTQPMRVHQAEALAQQTHESRFNRLSKEGKIAVAIISLILSNCLLCGGCSLFWQVFRPH